MRKNIIRQKMAVLALGMFFLFYAAGHADAFQYAWGENVGWLNLEPLGRDGPGVVVGETGLSSVPQLGSVPINESCAV